MTQTPTLHTVPATRRSLLALAFWIFVLLYGMAILYHPAFNIVDDHKFVDTVRVGRFLPPFIEPGIARFSPLLAQEYNLVSLVSNTATAFYAFNVVELFLVSWMLVRIGQAVPGDRHAAAPYVATALVLLSPAFTISWFRLWVQEKNELVLLTAFLLAYLKFRARPQRIFAILSFCFATLSLYAKESAFILVGAVGLFGLVFDHSPLTLSAQHRKAWRALHGLLLGSCVSFLAIYYFFIYRQKRDYRYAMLPGSKLMQILHAAAATLLHEPLLLLVLLLLTYQVFSRPRVSTPPPVRVLLLASISLVCAYLIFGLGNTYYLLPAYFVVTYLAAAVSAAPELSRAFRRPWFLFVAGVLILNQLVVAAQQISIWRTGADDFQAILPALEQQLRLSARPNLFLDGVTPGSGGEQFQGMADFLRADGLTDKDYDLRANVPVDTPYNHLSSYQADFSFKQAKPQIPVAGDLLLVTPADPIEDRSKFADRTQYAVVVETHSWAYENVGLKTLLRRAFRQPLGADVVIDPNYQLYRKLPDAMQTR